MKIRGVTQKIPDDVAEKMHAEFISGKTVDQLVKEYGVSKRSIMRLSVAGHWKEDRKKLLVKRPMPPKPKKNSFIKVVNEAVQKVQDDYVSRIDSVRDGFVEKLAVVNGLLDRQIEQGQMNDMDVKELLTAAKILSEVADKFNGMRPKDTGASHGPSFIYQSFLGEDCPACPFRLGAMPK